MGVLRSALTAGKPLLTWAAWILMLLVSDLPDILWSYLSPPVPGWLGWVKPALAGIFILGCLAVKSLRPLWQLGLYFLAFFAANWISPFEWWQNLFGAPPTWFPGHLGAQIGGLVALALVLGVFLLVRRNRRSLFLVKGRLDAELEPVRWLGIKKGEKWTTFWWIFSACFAGGMLIYLVAAYFPIMSRVDRLLPHLPAIVVLAALNSINEELTFRAPLLAVSHEAIGKQQALWLSAVFFGLAHVINGSPPGWIGFALIALAAYLYGKSMIETGGSFWALVMHFFSDLPVFAFLALQSVIK